jgi:hypothetical protein
VQLGIGLRLEAGEVRPGVGDDAALELQIPAQALDGGALGGDRRGRGLKGGIPADAVLGASDALVLEGIGQIPGADVLDTDQGDECGDRDEPPVLDHCEHQ